LTKDLAHILNIAPSSINDLDIT
jgi:hypothetical protein